MALFYSFYSSFYFSQKQHYDGDGVTITSTSGVPNAPSASLLREQTAISYDDQRRVYKTVVYDVNQSTGSVSSTGLTGAVPPVPEKTGSLDWFSTVPRLFLSPAPQNPRVF